MENVVDIQNWHTINAMTQSLPKRLNDIVVPAYDPARLEEYRNALVAILYRQPFPIVYCAHNAATGEYSLIRSNSVLEAYIHFTHDLFELPEGSHFSGKYSTWNLSDRRRVDEENITAEALSYTDSGVLKQVTDIITKLKS